MKLFKAVGHRGGRTFLCWLRRRVCLVGVVTTFAGASQAADVSSPKVSSGVFTFSFPSSANQLYTVQGSSTLPGNWVDLTNRLGNGAELTVGFPATGSLRFFRVGSVPYQAPSLSPQVPTLAGGEVSLPDATVGSPYLAEIVPQGLGPFTLQASGTPPVGFIVEAVSNGTASALLRLSATGSGLSGGERRQLTIQVTDSVGGIASKNYDVRIVGPPPSITSTSITWKAGLAATIPLQTGQGTGPFTWSSLSGTLPEGLTLNANGNLSGTPTAASAERNESGLHTNVIRVADSHTDRLTGAPTPRFGTNTLIQKVRFSFRLNIAASRMNGPSLQTSCFGCHGSFFPPDVTSDNALNLINVSSDPNGSCDDWVYVTRGNVSASLIAAKLRGPNCGSRMPQGGPFWTETRLRRLERWITELTPSDAD